MKKFTDFAQVGCASYISMHLLWPFLRAKFPAPLVFMKSFPLLWTMLAIILIGKLFLFSFLSGPLLSRWSTNLLPYDRLLIRIHQYWYPQDWCDIQCTHDMGHQNTSISPGGKANSWPQMLMLNLTDGLPVFFGICVELLLLA